MNANLTSQKSKMATILHTMALNLFVSAKSAVEKYNSHKQGVIMEREKIIETVMAFSPVERRIDFFGCEIGVSRQWYYEATAILMEINEGKYLKVPEDAIVLTKEELDKLHIFDDEMFERILNYEREKGRKETAKEILILLGKGLDETKMTEFKNLPWYKLFCRELKHRYGVEVDE